MIQVPWPGKPAASCRSLFHMYGAGGRVQDGFQRVYLPTEAEQVQVVQAGRDQVRVLLGAGDPLEMGEPLDHLAAGADDQILGHEAVCVQDVGGGERQAAGEDGLEDPLRHLSDDGVPLRQHQHGCQRPAVHGVDCLEGEPAEEPDVRPAIGLGPLAPDQVIEAGGGRREEAVEMLVAVVLVADVPEDEVPGLLGEHDRIRLVEETVVDREEQAVGARSRFESGLAHSGPADAPPHAVRPEPAVLVPDHGRGSAPNRVPGDQLCLAVQVAGVPLGAARGGVAPVDRPAPLQEQNVDVRGAAVEGVGVAEVVAGLDQVAVGLQENDLVAAAEEGVDQGGRRWLRPPSGVSVIPLPRKPQKLYPIFTW